MRGRQKFLSAHEHVLKGENPPLQVPTGMIVRTIRLIDANDVVITGSVWMRVPVGRADVEPAIDMPDAETLELRDRATQRKGADTVTSWTFKATLREPSESMSIFTSEVLPVFVSSCQRPKLSS